MANLISNMVTRRVANIKTGNSHHAALLIPLKGAR